MSSETKVVCLARLGGDMDTAGVYVLCADEVNISYLGKKRYVLWSKPGNYLHPKEEQKLKKKGGERMIRCTSLITDPCEWFEDPEAADRRAGEIRDELESKGELAVEGPIV